MAYRGIKSEFASIPLKFCRNWIKPLAKRKSDSTLAVNESICGKDRKTTVEKFLEDHSAPIDVEL